MPLLTSLLWVLPIINSTLCVMDSITHLVLGATLGEVLAGKKLGKKAMVLGALVQSFPDIDTVSSLWLDSASSLLAHRGFTHSFLFIVVVTPLFVLAGKKWLPNEHMTNISWSIFFISQLFVHLFLDSFNAYGTGWFEPFSHERFTFNVLFVADPLYTLWLIISTVALLVSSGSRSWRNGWASFGLVMSGFYLLLAIFNKVTIDREVRKSFEQQLIRYDRYFTTPTSFNSVLWFVVAEDNNGYHIGYRSILDRKPFTEFHYYERNDSLLAPLHSRQDVQKLIRFSQGYYVVAQTKKNLTFSDLRFGQLEGWSDPKMEFVFNYDLTAESQNEMVVQRGRFAHWNRALVNSMWLRMRGN